MRRLIVGALCALVLSVTPGPGAAGLAFAGPIHPMFHQEAEALLDRAATELRALGIPHEYLYLFMEEIGVSGGDPGRTDAAVVRNGSVENFVHRVPRRSVEGVRTLFDHHKEGEQAVYESIRLQGAFDNARAKQLLQTLEQIQKAQPQTLAVACPYCMVMFEDAAKNTGVDETLARKDVAEILLQSLPADDKVTR